MATPKKNTAFSFYVSLSSQASSNTFQDNPTLATGDVKVALDDAAPANITTLPVVDADFTKRIKVTLSAAEMNGDSTSVIFSDAAGDEWKDLHVNIPIGVNNVDDVKTDTAAVLVDTDTTIPALIAALNDLSAAQVNAEVLDVLATDTFAEPTGIPAATASLEDKISFIFTYLRNKQTQTSTTKTLLADDGATPIGTSTSSDDGTTYTETEWS